jgi:hypothetical protein
VQTRTGIANDRDDRGGDHHEHNVNTPVRLIGVIPVPGNPIVSADIAWVDPGTERYYLADRSNFGVDIIDAESNFYVGRVGGMVGPVGPNGPGPNGVLVTRNRKLWAGDVWDACAQFLRPRGRTRVRLEGSRHSGCQQCAQVSRGAA